jgi:glutathione synthase/RimK-type ligase-like ATP-grasp enzyme
MLALVTAAEAAGLDSDLEPLRQAFIDLAVPVVVVDWDDASVDWGRFDAVILRSTWDYVDRFDEFVVWLDRIELQTRVVNGRTAIGWNIDKHYLAELAAVGVPVVPTLFVEVGHTANGLDAERSVWVVKPAIGAGSNGAKRCTRAEVDAHIVVLHALGRAAMVQPYLDMIDAESETSLVFINDGSGLRYDHAFSKAAILQEARVAAGLKRNGDLVVKEEIGLRDATNEQIGLAEQVLASAPVQAVGPLAYARVDVVPTPTGSVLMELELIEPSLYFNSSEGSAARAASGWQQFLASTAEVLPVASSVAPSVA